ncbi:MAG: N-acetyltransferase [Chloroflexi bacterium]|nr:N-acetyltransferase [Chloroflexota bacterium]
MRPETSSDFDDIHRIVTAAFGRENEARLVRLLRADADAYIPQLTLVAEDGDEIVGHIMLSSATIHGEQNWRVLALGPLAVTPERQRTGVGIALTEASLELADARGDSLVVLLGHPTYYPRFGFESARGRGIEPPTAMMSDAAFMVKALSNYDERIRGKFAYAPAFDEVSS